MLKQISLKCNEGNDCHFIQRNSVRHVSAEFYCFLKRTISFPCINLHGPQTHQNYTPFIKKYFPMYFFNILKWNSYLLTLHIDYTESLKIYFIYKCCFYIICILHKLYICISLCKYSGTLTWEHIIKESLFSLCI